MPKTPSALILKTVDQPEVVIAKEDIELRKVSEKSMMPDGQLQQLSKQANDRLDQVSANNRASGACPVNRVLHTTLALVALSVTPPYALAQNELPKQQHRTSNAPFLKPAEAVAKMSIPVGFDVSVFASEPDIGEPIAFCFDDRGRMWIVENLNYRTRREHTDDPVSRIQIFQDTDGDGVFDNKKTFTDSLTFTSGIAIGFGGVFVGSPPNFSFIPDADGDDKPDGPPQVLLDGWGINDRHETLNSFILGSRWLAVWLPWCVHSLKRRQAACPRIANVNSSTAGSGVTTQRG